MNESDKDLVFEENDEAFTGAKKKDRVKKEKYRNAIQAIARGECNTITAASEKYEVNRGTLSKLLETGRNFQGSGSGPQIFSKEEEKIIVERIS